jgi:tRNA 2-thiocytidine biosynthesis protein TtcA
MPRLSPCHDQLRRQLGRALGDFELIEDGDRILVAMSGGKDSYALLDLLQLHQARAPVRYELVAWHLDQVQPGHDPEPLRAWLQERGVETVIERQDTYSIVLEKTPPGSTYCALCSRLRRGILYGAAQRLGCSKIALGHHRDDLVETLLLNLFFSGQIKSMPVILRSDDERNTVIRPLAYCAEGDLESFAKERAYPILPCNLCGSQDGLQRQRVKGMLRRLETDHPRIKESLLASLFRVRVSHTLDRELWNQVGHDPWS